MITFADTTHWTLTATAELPPELEDRVIEKISTEQIHFQERVLKLEAHITFAKKSSIVFQLKVKDMYDLQDIQCDILSGIFLQRFVSWLKDDGLKIGTFSAMMRITGISKGIGPFEQGGSCSLLLRVTDFEELSKSISYSYSTFVALNLHPRSNNKQIH